MTWRENLRPASFRNVPFEVEGDGGTFGRRTVLHEYPQRDKPGTEDMGRASRTFEITGFLVGDDYMERRDALLEALETEGPGKLIHPWYGELTVNVKDSARISHSTRDGGMCQVTLSFVESGDLQFPTAASSLGAQALLSIDAVEVVARDDFLSSFGVDGFPAFVLDGVAADLAQFVAVAGSYLDGLQQLLADPLGTLLDLAGLPGNPMNAVEAQLGLGAGLADAVLGLFHRGSSVLVSLSPTSAYGGGAYARNRNAVVALTQMASAFGGLAVQPTSLAPATYQAQLNRCAVATLIQRAALIQAAGMTASMELPVYDDAVLVRASVVGAIDEASLEAADDVYVPLQTLRARVHADLTARMTSTARLRAYTPREVMTGLALAYDLYEDVSRETELIERNAILHPGFLPARPLKVLSA